MAVALLIVGALLLTGGASWVGHDLAGTWAFGPVVAGVLILVAGVDAARDVVLDRGPDR